MTGNPLNKTLLAVLAHPDDESFGMGGTLALYARRGVSVYLVCATRGEAGTVDADCLDGFTSVGERREYELRCAAQSLGLAGVYFLGYRDSGMPGSVDNQHPDALVNAPLEDVTAKVTHYIRLLKPQVVITFDPIGVYRHPDHIAIHKATVQAFHAAGDPARYPGDPPPYQPQKLYFHTISKRLLKMAVGIMPLFGRDPRKFGRNKDIDLASLAKEDFPVHAVIDYQTVIDQKTLASICHDSQGGGNLQKGLVGWIFQMAGSKDTYMRAYPQVTKRKRERDLFEGVRADRS